MRFVQEIRTMLALATMSLMMANCAHAETKVPAGNVQQLDISGCPGSITLQQSGSVKEPQFLTSGNGGRARLASVASGWALHCHASPGTSLPSGASGQSGVNISGVIVNRAFGPGARAVQNIGGGSAIDSSSGSSVVKLQVPVGVKIYAKSWIGSLDAERGVWTVDAELASGQMHFSHLQDSVVVVDSGSLSVLEATGLLSAHLRGGGNIEVANMRNTVLELRLSGAGNMAFKGRAASARIWATGAGHIDIERVVSEPWIHLRGAATVDIGR